MATLYIVATPIGNLEDASPRALRVLREATKIFCEDTRVTRKLLAAYHIHTPCETLHQHSGMRVYAKVVELLRSGKDVAFATDAGTPAVSDPGGQLVEYIVASEPDSTIVPIPGPAAVTTLLAVAGLPADRFLFLGFVPTKQGRAKFFSLVSESPYTTVFLESPHRIRKTLSELGHIDGSAGRRIVIGRELTKLYEEIIRGTVADVSAKASAIKEKGEFTIAIEGRS